MIEYVPSYSMPWNERRCRHLLRRCGFGASAEMIKTLSQRQPIDLVAEIVREARLAPPLALPVWYKEEGLQTDEDWDEYRENRIDWYREIQRNWMVQMNQSGLREKMTFFWSNHFVTEGQKYNYNPYLAHEYLSLLREYSLGNFKEFVYKVGLLPAMVIYLDGEDNKKGAPNENYGRELMELFTMGIGNYTETDIKQVAKALTGYVYDDDTFKTVFVPERFDDGFKTFFGHSGRFGYDHVIDIIFQEKAEAIAEFITTKLYRFFVYNEPDSREIRRLARYFLQVDFEIAPVVEKLLSSAHFFEEEFIGAKIKSPVELIQGLYFDGGKLPNQEDRTLRRSSELEQELLSPPNVAGWKGHREWITTKTFPRRWDMARSMIYDRNAGRPDLVAVAKRMDHPNNPHKLAVELADFWLGVELPAEDRERLSGVLLGDIPDYEWDIDDPGTVNLLLGYFNYIVRLPEYQLT